MCLDRSHENFAQLFQLSIEQASKLDGAEKALKVALLDIEELHTKLAELRETNRRLNRRCQEAESAAVQAERKYTALGNVWQSAIAMVNNDHNRLRAEIYEIRSLVRYLWPRRNWLVRLYARMRGEKL